MYRVSDRVHVYAAASRGFETPTINELSYRPDGAAGLNWNCGLRAASTARSA